MVDIVFILIILRPKYCQENIENSISKHLNFKIFWGGMPPDPPRKLAPQVQRSRSRLPPTFPVGTSTSKLIDSTGLAALQLYLQEKYWFFNDKLSQ